jgi:hypothetical protein
MNREATDEFLWLGHNKDVNSRDKIIIIFLSELSDMVIHIME